MPDLKIKAGKSYNIILPNSGYLRTKTHIDYILDNPKNEMWDRKLIICRNWGRFQCLEYWELAIYNDWKWSKKII